MSMLEAECTRCSEIFVPHGVDPEDLIHCYTEETDSECGGIGIIQGQWIFGDGAPNNWRAIRALTKMEMHGKEYPNCEDPDCEFHHPELIEV